MTVGKNPKIFRMHYGGDLKAGLQLLSGRSGAPHSYYPETVLLANRFQRDFREKLYSPPQWCVVSVPRVLACMESEIRERKLSCPAFA